MVDRVGAARGRKRVRASMEVGGQNQKQKQVVEVARASFLGAAQIVWGLIQDGTLSLGWKNGQMVAANSSFEEITGNPNVTNGHLSAESFHLPTPHTVKMSGDTVKLQTPREIVEKEGGGELWTRAGSGQQCAANVSAPQPISAMNESMYR